MSRKLLGLDIRSSSASAVLMESSFKKCVISGFAHAPFPVDGSDHDRLAAAIAAISSKMDLKDCLCAMSIPSDRFFFRNLSVPFSEPKKIHQMLPYELESALPFPVEDLLIDFDKLPIEGPESDTRIIAAGIETERLKMILDTIDSGGITPHVVFPAGYASAAWLCSNVHSEEPHLFIDVDGKTGSLYLLLKGAISLIRSFPLPPDQAESAIRIWSHIHRSIAGFESLSETKIIPEAIIINGFQNENFPEQLQTAAAVPVQTLHIDPPAGCDSADVSPLSCYNDALSCALFLRDGFKGMNFRKGPLASRNQLSEHRSRLIRTAVIAGILFLFWLAGGVAGNFMTQRKVDTIDAQIRAVFQSTFPNIHTIVEPVHQMRTQIEILKKAAYGSTDLAARFCFIDFLKNISQAVPSDMDVIFSKLTLSEDGIYIDGTTASFNQVDELKTKIEKIENVLSVTPTSTARDGERIRFKLRIETGLGETP